MERLFTKLKAIEPSKDFKERSLALILNSHQNQPKTLWDFLLAGAHPGIAPSFAALGIILVLGGLSILNNYLPSKSLVSSLNQETLSAEAKSLDIQIQLSQVQYYEDSAKKIEVALNQASDEKN